MPKRSMIRNGPSMSERINLGWRRTSDISLVMNAPARMRRLRSLATVGVLASGGRIPVHEFDEHFVERRPVFLDPADVCPDRLQDIQYLWNGLAGVFHMDAHLSPRYRLHMVDEIGLEKALHGDRAQRIPFYVYHVATEGLPPQAQRRVNRDEPAGADHSHPVAELALAHVLRGDENGASLIAQPTELLP